MAEDDDQHDEVQEFSFGAHAWCARGTLTKVGRPPVFETPQDLLNECHEYFKWTAANPLQASEVVKFQGTGTVMAVPKMRVATIHGLCAFLDINRTTWDDIILRPGFEWVGERVKDAIYQQKFEAAAVDLLNSAFISRDLGLADRLEHVGGGGLLPTTPEMTLEEATRVVEDNLRELRGEK